MAEEGEVIFDGGDSTNFGIYLYEETSSNNVYNIIIKGIKFRHFIKNGINVHGYSGTPDYISGVTIENCQLKIHIGYTQTKE